MGVLDLEPIEGAAHESDRPGCVSMQTYVRCLPPAALRRRWNTRTRPSAALGKISL